MLSFPRGTEMFQFPRFPPTALCVQAAVTLHDECWVSPFGHLRIEAQSTAPRSFSQSLTSFFGSWRQGIHRWLFVAWKEQDCLVTHTGRTPCFKMLVLALQFSRSGAVTARSSERRRRAVAGEGTPSKRKRRRMPPDPVARGRDRIPVDLELVLRQPTSAPTGVSRAGWNICPPSAERHSLERR